jgi:hypothetical protein
VNQWSCALLLSPIGGRRVCVNCPTTGVLNKWFTVKAGL